ncbi:MAG: hypothetical protein A2Y80_07130 [Deltaproteobacteria bacterium RBG_13_58_19]|nr:MAG: hypothetical protein A2Y80_07130 [Deltaproteobacteria bacterium RBG_13_58_19]
MGLSQSDSHAPAGPRGISLLWVALLLLITPVVVFWRPQMFFNGDDWIALWQISANSFGQYLITPDTEHWYPFFKLIFYSLLKVFGTHYSLLVLINCLLAGVNAFLLYLFCQRLFSPYLALTLALIYILSGAQTTGIWTAHNITLILCLGFFLGALLLTDSYLSSPRPAYLLGIGLCAGLSTLSNNSIILGLAALPLYALLTGGATGRSRFWPLAVLIGLVYLLFGWGYFTFAGLDAASSHNIRLFAGLPGPGYLLHWFYASFLSPFIYLFWGHYHFPVWAIILGILLLALCLALIWWRGETQDRWLAFWALILNSLPFFLTSLIRYQRSIDQAFVPRYTLYTLIGALILLGTAWRSFSRKQPQGLGYRLIPLALLLVLLAGQILSLPKWEKMYAQMSQDSLNYYRSFPESAPPGQSSPDQAGQSFMQARHPGLTVQQKQAIRRFLSDLPPDT